MDKESFVWKVAGAAGEGIMTTGLLLSKTFARSGLHVFDYSEYPSLIRGGTNTYQVHASKFPVYCQSSRIDLLVAINKDGLEKHLGEIDQGSIVLYDKEDDKIEINKYKITGKTFNLPMVRLAKEFGGKEVMGNNVALGASVYLLGLDISLLDEVINDVFSNKGKNVVELNQKAAHAGYDYLKARIPQIPPLTKGQSQFLTMTGNEAISLGSLAGGLQFYAAYPMTPASSILHYLAEKAKDAGIVVKHAEDEISAVDMALGASFAGTRAMVATSGGGFCYMVEALGLAGIAELPLVIVEAMRPGPALGMPTWTAQGDLKFILNAGNGEFPRFVLAPGDALEAFDLARRAQELAEKYQTPVILVSDKHLSESRYSLKLETSIFINRRYGFSQNPKQGQNDAYPRYLLNDSNISDRTVPGIIGGTHIANSYTHNQYGLSSEESNESKSQVDKLFQKLEKMRLEIPQQFWEVEPNSQITFISFGSTKGQIKEAKPKLKKENIPINMLNLSWLWPFPKEQVRQAIKSSQNVIVVEGNSQGQLADLITQETGIIIKNRLNRYDGRPFYVEDIVDYAKKLTKNA